jgi:hypothetical protein
MEEDAKQEMSEDVVKMRERRERFYPRVDELRSLEMWGALLVS